MEILIKLPTVINNSSKFTLMKNILFPTDFSDNAQNAYNYALHLADKLQASIVTLHAYMPVQVPVDMLHNTVAELGEMQELEELDNYREAAKEMHRQASHEHLEGVEVSHKLQPGAAVDTILNVVETEGIDLIVMGTKGASGLIGNLIGSNTSEVIGEADVPVMAIPANANYHPIRKMAIAIDLEELQEDVVAKAIEYAALFNAELHCVYVNVAHNPFIGERMAKLASTFADTPKLTFETLEGYEILKVLDKYIAEKDIDILVMQTHERTFFQKLFGVSHTRRMAFHVDVPLLVFKK